MVVLVSFFLYRDDDHRVQHVLTHSVPTRRAADLIPLIGTVIGDFAYFGPELEFFVFDDVRYGQGTNYGRYEISAREANWPTAREAGVSLGHKQIGRANV